MGPAVLAGELHRTLAKRIDVLQVLQVLDAIEVIDVWDDRTRTSTLNVAVHVDGPPVDVDRVKEGSTASITKRR